MSLDYELLRTLHRMLRQLTDIGERMEKGPRKVKIVIANETEFSTAFDESKQRVLELRKASNAKQLQLLEREAKIEDVKGKLNTCETNREFQLLKDRIAADLQANSVLQDEILEQLEKLDVLTAEVEEAKQNLEKSQAESKNIRGQVELELKALKSEKARIESELAVAETKLPAEFCSEYRRIVAGKGEDALGATNTETCGNCNQRITPNMVNDLMMKKPVFCQGCGCWMYLTEGHIAGR